MVYEYNSKIVNRSNDFNDKNNFVGYILPDGSIYECIEHNVYSVYSVFKMYLQLLEKEYDKKNEILDIETDDKLAQIVLNKLKNMSYDEIKAFISFDNGSYTASDLFVSFFGCHLITRLKKVILTSELNHYSFYNYLLHDFKIVTIPKILYNEKTKKYQFKEGLIRNDYLYDEIKKIKSEAKESQIELFHKNR